MSQALRRRLVTAAITAASVALVATPAADAAKKKSVDKTQSAAIKKQGTAIKKVTKTANSADKSAKSAGKSAKQGVADAKAAAGKADAAQGTANAILGGVPQILDGLTKLATGLQQAADGLNKLAANAAAQEYGVVKVQIGGTDVDGAILTSGDIPDDSNTAVVSGTMMVKVPASTPATAIQLLAGVRSGEADGTGANDPVASAGIASMTVASAMGGSPAAGAVTIAGGNVGLPEAPLTSAPNAAAGGAPVYAIPLKAPRVDAAPNPFSFPTDLAIDLTDPARLVNLSGAGVGPFTVANLAPSPVLITVTVTVRFNDLTASATDVTA
jgi:X-X-X-Leu-X-X-Gly heptad repeat protein